MKEIRQEYFKEPDNLAEIGDEPLIIHRNNSVSNNQLIVFVHGLGGSRYGKTATWGNFPLFIFQDIKQANVGLYEYRTLFRRHKVWKSISLENEAKVFAEIIRDELINYRTIILVGHSMGGLLCKAVISHLIGTEEWDVLSRIGGLILMATPQLGSMRIPRLSGWFSSDFQALKPHGKFVAAINERFENKLNPDETNITVDKIVIPTFAVLGASDFWVDQLSSGIGLSSKRKKYVHGSHTEIVKPKDKENSAYRWVCDKVNSCLARFKYDVFISSPMASLPTNKEYKKHRFEANQLAEILRKNCNFQSVFYAGSKITSKEKFDAQDISLEEDLRALKDSRYFLLHYPDKIVSSVLFEAGLAQCPNDQLMSPRF